MDFNQITSIPSIIVLKWNNNPFVALKLQQVMIQ